MRIKYLTGAICLSLCALTASGATTFTDRATFEAAVLAAMGGTGVISTDDFSGGALANSTTINFTGPNSTSSTGSPAGLSLNQVANNRFEAGIGSATFLFNNITWNIGLGDVFAVGFDIFSPLSATGLQVTGNFDGGGDVSLNLASDLANLETAQFWGVIGTSFFNSITFSETAPDPQALNLFQIDDYSIGRSIQVSDVPEPGTMSLLGAGLMALGLFGRKRLRS